MTTINRTDKALEVTDGTGDRLILTNALGSDLVIAYTRAAHGDPPQRVHDLVAIDLEAARAIVEFLEQALPCPDHFVGTKRLRCDTCGGTR